MAKRNSQCHPEAPLKADHLQAIEQLAGKADLDPKSFALFPEALTVRSAALTNIEVEMQELNAEAAVEQP